MNLDGKKTALSIEQRLKLEVDDLMAKQQRLPHLTVVLVGDNPASEVYVKHKVKACARVGIQSSVVKLAKEVEQATLIQAIETLNQDDKIDGILVQLPLPKHLDEKKVIESLDPSKDVDGLHSVNVAKLYGSSPGFIPCTPKGVISLLDAYDMPIQGKHALVIGRSALVGRPVAQLLINRNATVTVCHSKTPNIAELSRLADILVVAIGRPHFVDLSYVQDNQVIIDVGINRVEDRLVGDVDYELVFNHVKAITPVPGGVGPMTIASLLENTLLAYHLRVNPDV